MTKHPNCAERCQLVEDKGYRPCAGDCYYARMSDTPRTDAVEFYAGDLDGGQEAVPADFARQLEREIRVDFARQLEREVEALHALLVRNHLADPELYRRIQEAVKARLRAEVAFDEWMARELPRATGYEIDLCRTVWLAASKPDSAGGQSG